MDEIISKIEDKIVNMLDVNNKCLNALRKVLEENKEIKEKLEAASVKQDGVEEQLLKLLSNIESAESVVDETKEAHSDLYEIL